METLTREPDTMRVRQIQPRENVKSLYDELAGPDAQFYVRTNLGKMIRTCQDVPPGCSPYEYYIDTDVAEDAILFEEEQLEGVQNIPFVEISNPVQQLKSTHMPLSMLNHKANQLTGEMPDALEEILGISRKKLVEKKGNTPYAPGSEKIPFEAPPSGSNSTISSPRHLPHLPAPSCLRPWILLQSNSKSAWQNSRKRPVHRRPWSEMDLTVCTLSSTALQGTITFANSGSPYLSLQGYVPYR